MKNQKQLVNNELDEQFNILNKKFDLQNYYHGSLHTLPQLKNEGEAISDNDLEKVLILFQKGVIVKEGIPKALVQSSRNEKYK